MKILRLKKAFARATGREQEISSRDLEITGRTTQEINEAIIETIEIWIISNRIELKHSDDFGLSFEQVSVLQSLINDIAGAGEKRAFREYLQEILIRQLDLQIDLLNISINEKTSEDQLALLRKEQERLGRVSKIEVFKKETIINELKVKIKAVDEKYKDAEKKLGKLINQRIVDRDSINKLKQELNGLKAKKDGFNDEIRGAESALEREKTKNKSLIDKVKAMEATISNLKSEARNIQSQRDRLAKENARIQAEQ